MDNALQNILELSRDPMLAIADGKICLMNSAARRCFPRCRVGDSASALIPEPVVFEQSDSFVCTAAIEGVRYTVSAARSEGILYLSLEAEHPAAEMRGFLSDSLLNGMLSTLFNIGLSADRLRASLDPAEKDAEKYLAMLDHNYYALRRRLTNLNALCALSEGGMELVLYHTDLVKLCRNIVSTASLLTRDACAAVEFCSELEALPACMDAPKVEHLILNLLSNSLKHTPKDGQVRLRLGKSGSNALISVDDNGSGIPPVQLKSVFHSFQNRLDADSLRADPGAGLGLGLCRVIAEMHGGTLILESREGEGTTVRVLLPLTPPGPGELMSALPEFTNGGMTVILTELSDLLDERPYRHGFPD